jgi:hypothetical protein
VLRKVKPVYWVHTAVVSLLLFLVRNGSERLRKAVFCVRNGSVTPREEGSTKQTQDMLLGRWCAEGVAYRSEDLSWVRTPPWVLF